MSEKIKIKGGSVFLRILLGNLSLLLSFLFGFKSMWVFFGVALACSQMFILIGYFEKHERILEKRFELLQDTIMTLSKKNNNKIQG